jgi:hypothetical protein
MPVTVEKRSDNGLVLLYSGVLTGEEVINVKRTLITEQNRGLRYLIVDTTATNEIHISGAELRGIAEENKRLAAIAEPGMLAAVAAPQDLAFGLSRMWEVIASDTGWRTSVFRSRAEADAWIQRNLNVQQTPNKDEKPFRLR